MQALPEADCLNHEHLSSSDDKWRGNRSGRVAGSWVCAKQPCYFSFFLVCEGGAFAIIVVNGGCSHNVKVVFMVLPCDVTAPRDWTSIALVCPRK